MSSNTINNTSASNTIINNTKKEENAPPPAYDLHRSDEGDTAAVVAPYNQHNSNYNSNLNYNYNYNYAGSEEEASSEGYLDIHTATGGGGNDSGTVGTAGHIHNHLSAVGGGGVGANGGGEPPDATEAVAEMHLALLYLLSHPHEFERAVEHSAATGNSNNNNNTTTLQQWNAEYYNDDQSLYTEAESVGYLAAQKQLSPTSNSNSNDSRRQTRNNSNNSNNNNNNNSASSPPLPFAIFCDDAEVVLPQAHTASQLFGLETVTGMELEAAAGVASVSRLFLRWLALMPGGDHLNLIDPPGLTVMRIAGGRYRVTAAHRAVWTWRNDFERVSDRNVHINALQPGDLVSLTVVDVFETDARGKLLSYCPTFDNRRVLRQDRTAHALRKRSLQVRSALRTASNSALAAAVRRHAADWASRLVRAVDGAVHHHHGNRGEDGGGGDGGGDADLHYDTTTATTTTSSTKGDNNRNKNDNNNNNSNNDMVTIPAAPPRMRPVPSVAATSTAYHADDDMERHEV